MLLKLLKVIKLTHLAQPLTTHGDVEDEQNLSPDWNSSLHYRQDDSGATYVSTDQLGMGIT